MSLGKDPWDNSLARRDAAVEARELLSPIREEVVDLLQSLVRIDSVAVPPQGNEARAQQVLLEKLLTCGVDAELYDTSFLAESEHRLVRHERDYRNRPHLIARLPGRGRGRSLLFSGHIDTVPPGAGTWSDQPFSGKVLRGRLYGRGAWDMKGGLVAHFAVLIALKRAERKLAGELLAESVVDEEWAGGGGTLAARLKGIAADACVITEGTGLRVVHATRGGFFLDIVAEAGDSSAYFSQDEVVSPAIPMGRLLAWVDEWRKRRKNVHPGETYKGFPDPAPVQVLALEANRFDPETPWSTPLQAKLRLYFQFLPHEDQDAVIHEVRTSFENFCRDDLFFRAFPPVWQPVVDPPLVGHELPVGHSWTCCMAEASAEVLGAPAVISAAEYPCDAFINQREFGIPTLLFGPSGAGAHNVDEYVEIESVLQAAEVLLTSALLWCD
ncbi:MAG: M20/M25/M40 family metallo-hydrolase [Acidobacteriota bacterium]|nr:MAG: M20/M25/M40 family metallo-hydrolase [Acidobacteriota bacterium]